MQVRRVVLAALAAGLVAEAARAQEPGAPVLDEVPDASLPEREGAGVNVTVGAFAVATPEYEGAEDYRFLPFPFLSIEAGSFYLNPLNGIGAVVAASGGFSVATGAGYDFGGGDRPDGLDDVDAGATANLTLAYEAGPWNAGVGFSYGLGSDTGLVAQAEAGRTQLIGPRALLSLDLTLTVADDDHAEALFGISPGEAARTGFAAYDPDGGLKSAGAEALLIYFLSDNWSTQLRFAYERLLNDFADSPIVEDENQFTGALGLTYSFSFSG